MKFVTGVQTRLDEGAKIKLGRWGRHQEKPSEAQIVRPLLGVVVINAILAEDGGTMGDGAE